MKNRIAAAALLFGAIPAAASAAGQTDPVPLAEVPVLQKSMLTVACHGGPLPDRYDVARFLGGPGSFGIEAARDELLREVHRACSRGYTAVRVMRQDDARIARMQVGARAIAERDER